MAEKKPRVKKEREKGKPQRAIQWFQDKAEKTQDVDVIRKAAKEEKYADATITIQIGRLRGMGLLPKAEPKAKAEAKKKPKAVKKSFHPVPKPSQKDAA